MYVLTLLKLLKCFIYKLRTLFFKQVLMAEFTRENKYRNNVARFMDSAMNIRTTPQGLTWKSEWGPNRYAGKFVS